MKTHFAFLAIALLLTASFGMLLGNETDLQVTGAPIPDYPNDYHNATIHLNVTLGSGAPASDHEVVVKRSLNDGYFDSGVTDSTGKLDMDVNIQFHGLTQLLVYNQTGAGVYKERIELWPDDEIFKDIMVDDPLVPINRVHGTLRNAIDNSPVVDHKITLYGFDTYGSEISETSKTNSEGEYSLLIPNSTESLRLYSFDGQGGFVFDIDLILQPDTTDHPMDLFWKQGFTPAIPAHFRVKDRKTGEFQNDGRLDINGYYDILDSKFRSNSTVTPSGTDFWYNISLEQGEFVASWSEKGKAGEATFYYDQYFYMNDTELFKDIEFTSPDLKTLEIEVWNNTSPLRDVTLSCYDSSYEVGVNSYSYTDITGNGKLMVPANRSLEVEISRSKYQAEVLRIDTSGPATTLEFNITLESTETFEYVYADLEIQVIDEVSGVAIPNSYARIQAYREGVGRTYSYRTNETGIFDGRVIIGDDGGMFTEFYAYSNSHIGDAPRTRISLVEGSNDPLIISLERKVFEGQYINTYFHIRDGSGNPIPYQRVYVQMYGIDRYLNVDTVSDGNGRVNLNGPPGEYSISVHSSFWEWRNHWAGRINRMEVTETGSLGVLTVYPTSPLTSYTGVVRDSSDMKTIQNVKVISSSVRKDGDLTREEMIPEDWLNDDLDLFYMNSGTNEDGFYRAKGVDSTELKFTKRGYFDKKVNVQQITRDLGLDDVIMEQVTPFSLWVNGTLMDHLENPIDGYIIVFDIDHDEHLIQEYIVNETGDVALELYPGNFSFWLINDTLEDLVEVHVGADGVEGLELMLIPEAEVWGTVEDREGIPVEGINVTLINPDINEPGQWMLTDEFGDFSFMAPPGYYYIVVEGTELYDVFMGTTFEMDGWIDEYFEITLENRSVADIYVAVFGEAGPLVGGVPDALLSLMLDGVEVDNAISDSSGGFEFLDIDHGTNYSISATPPTEWEPVVDLESGYLMNSTLDITVSGALVEVDVALPFVEYQPAGWLEFSDHMPVGMDVLLDEDIIVEFSRPINISTFIEAFSIEPEIEENFTLNVGGDSVIITHPPFEPNTTYEVMIAGSVFSVEEWPLHDYEGLTWNFTTSDELSNWKITSAEVDVDAGKNVSFDVKAVRDTTVYVMIDGVGSFQLLQELPGTFRITIAAENFDWDGTYTYHFSDQVDGGDLAMAFSGTFTTPSEPGPDWDLTVSIVDAEEDGSISVEAHGPPGLSVWINIVGIGWYELQEDDDGIYIVTIPANDLEWDTEYSFFYSNQEAGTDLEPGLSRTIRTVQEPDNGDDDDDDDDSSMSAGGKIALYSLGCCGVLLLLIFVILIMMVIAKRRSKGKGFDEE